MFLLAFLRAFLCFLPPVSDQQGELGGAELGRRLPAPDAGLHEVALRGVRHQRALLHQHPRRGALPGPGAGPLPGRAGPADHQPADTVRCGAGGGMWGWGRDVGLGHLLGPGPITRGCGSPQL